VQLAFPSTAREQHAVTVVIPCYNYGRYLSDAVLFAFQQDRVAVRVVIVDDCSTDDSLLIARQIEARDGRVSVISHKQNRGHIQTYNDGLAAVRTEYVTLVSADDLIAPGALDRAVSLMEAFPKVGLVYGKVVVFDDATVPGASYRSQDGIWVIWSGLAWTRRIVHLGYNPIKSPEAVLRTQTLTQVGDYNPALPHSGDLEYWLRVAVAGWDVGQVRRSTQAFYRVHGRNMHTQHFGSIENIEQKFAAFQALSRHSRLYRRGTRTLVREALRASQGHLQRGDTVEARGLLAFVVDHALDTRERAVASSLLRSAH
jgi:glycosyltransferase involved in cell wall biosynthesis